MFGITCKEMRGLTIQIAEPNIQSSINMFLEKIGCEDSHRILFLKKTLKAPGGRRSNGSLEIYRDRSYRRLVYSRSDVSLVINRDRSLVHSTENSRSELLLLCRFGSICRSDDRICGHSGCRRSDESLAINRDRRCNRLVYRRSDGSLAFNRDRLLVHPTEHWRGDSVFVIVLGAFRL